MTIIIGEKPRSGTRAPYYKRMIKCPGHYLVPPQEDIYLRVPMDDLKHCRDIVDVGGKPFKIKKWKVAKDKFGNKLIDWKKLYKLRDAGIVLNPLISASEAIERIWDPKSCLCLHCDKRCMEGKNGVNEHSIKRLHGWQPSQKFR